MTKRIVVAAVSLTAIVLAAIAPAASAHTIIRCEGVCELPYQRFVDESLVPTPNVEVTVREQNPPCVVGGGFKPFGCTFYEPGAIEIVMLPHQWMMRGTFFHELGHVYDDSEVQPWQREAFSELAVANGRPWGNELPWGEGVDEWFAEAYSLCARWPSVAFNGAPSIGDRVASRRALVKMCWLMGRKGPDRLRVRPRR